MHEKQSPNWSAGDKWFAEFAVVEKVLQIGGKNEWNRRDNSICKLGNLDEYSRVDLFMFGEGTDAIIAIHDYVDD